MVDLEGCAAKLRRVEEQLYDLNRRVHFYQRESHRITRKDDAGKGRITFYVTDIRPPPLEIGVMVGEIVHNLHSCLDNLIHRLYERGRKRANGRTAFPIMLEERDFDARSESKVGKLPDDVKLIIKLLQPFNSEDPDIRSDRNLHPLALLDRLSITDKHVVTNRLKSTELGGVGHSIPDGITVVEKGPVRLVEGAKILVVQVTDGRPTTEKQIYPHLSFDIVFADGFLKDRHVQILLCAIYRFIYKNVFLESGLTQGFEWSYEPRRLAVLMHWYSPIPNCLSCPHESPVPQTYSPLFGDIFPFGDH